MAGPLAPPLGTTSQEFANNAAVEHVFDVQLGPLSFSFIRDTIVP